MELRSRSRSTTPLRAAESDHSHSLTPNSTDRVLRSTKLRTVTEVNEDSVTMKVTTNSSHKSSKLIKEQHTTFTSDYSSEDGEHDLSRTENNTNHALEFKQEMHKQSNDHEFIALKMYRDAKEYWNFYPKTDYTYSPHSKDRVELAPGVVNMPNMSRRPIHSGDGVEFDHKETSTDFITENRRGIVPRALFSSSSNNNEEYLYKESKYTSTRSRTEISIFRRVFYSVFYVLYMASRPLAMAHSLTVRIVSRAHQFASHVMMFDTWLLRGVSSDVRSEESSRQRRKLVNVLALCLLPLIFFGGIWLLSALGQALALLMATSSEKITPPITATVSAPLAADHASETVIKIQLDSPFRAGLSGVQLKQIAHSLKHNLNLDLDVDTIMKVLLVDPNVQRLDESTPADVAAALTKEQIAGIAHNLKHVQRESVDNVVEKVLESPSIQNFIASYNTKDQSDQITAQEGLINELRLQIEKLRLDLNAAMMGNSANYVQLSHSIKRCCRLNALQMEKYLHGLITAILNSKDHKDNLSQWLGTLFVAQNELELKLHNATEKLNKHFDDLIKESAQVIMEDVSLKLAGRIASTDASSSGIPPDEMQIRAIVKSALATYDADKTGLVDYALESAGGQILSTRCTEHYSAKTSVVSIFGVPLWYPTATPRTVITPGVIPGECWAFQSFPGFVIVKLSHNVTINAFSYEHVSRYLIPSGRVDSAPKNFQVYGLHHEYDKEPVLLGEYQYDAYGDALQFFPVDDAAVLMRSFQVVELKVNSNHGNPNYTCLYRFRVHGKVAT